MKHTTVGTPRMNTETPKFTTSNMYLLFSKCILSTKPIVLDNNNRIARSDSIETHDQQLVGFKEAMKTTSDASDGA